MTRKRLAAVLLAGMMMMGAGMAEERPARKGRITEALGIQMEKKLAEIERRAKLAARPKEPMVFSEDELNSYFQFRMSGRIPPGVSEIRFQLRPEAVTASALMDFDKIKATAKKPVHPLVGMFLKGQSPSSVSAKFTSSNGSGLLHLEEVAVGGLALRGFLLDLAIRNFVLPRYPTAAIDRPFKLDYSIDRIILTECRAIIYQK